MQVLILERTYLRTRTELERVAPEARFVRVQDDGTLQLDGAVLAVEDAQLEVAWASRDLYAHDAGESLRAFMVAILKSQSMRWMHSGGAGVDHPVFATISKKGIRLSNSDSGAVAMAEYVMAGVLDCYQPQAERREYQAARRWKSTPFREIAGTTWLVVGLGNIGREVATRARAFAAHVIGVRRTPVGDEPVDELIAPDALPLALPRADVVLLCASLNDSTRGLVDGRFLATMKPGSLLVNVARGGMVDEAALLESLDRGVPRVALLDVFESEPLPADSRLWEHPHVRISAHCAADGSGSGARSDRGFLENLSRYVAGQPLSSEIAPATLGK
jgi:phosphoglycerate dehydrogenase-like enzyme